MLSNRREGAQGPQCAEEEGPKDLGVVAPLTAAGCRGNCWRIQIQVFRQSRPLCSTTWTEGVCPVLRSSAHQPRVRSLIVVGTLVSTMFLPNFSATCFIVECIPIACPRGRYCQGLAEDVPLLSRSTIPRCLQWCSVPCVLQVCEKLQSGVKADPPDANRTSNMHVTRFIWNQLSTRVSLASR